MHDDAIMTWAAPTVEVIVEIAAKAIDQIRPL